MDRKHIAGRDRFPRRHRLAAKPGGPPHQAPRTARSVHGHAAARGSISPRPSARASQSARIVANPAPRSHCDSRSNHRAGQYLEQSAAVTLTPTAPQVGRRIFRVARMMRRSSRQYRSRRRASGRRSFALEQDAANFLAVAQHVIRPFQRKSTARSREIRAIASCTASAATNDNCASGPIWTAGVRQQQRRVKIARRRCPVPAAPAAPGGLLPRRRSTAARARLRARAPTLRRWSTRACRAR